MVPAPATLIALVPLTEVMAPFTFTFWPLTGTTVTDVSASAVTVPPPKALVLTIGVPAVDTKATPPVPLTAPIDIAELAVVNVHTPLDTTVLPHVIVPDLQSDTAHGSQRSV